MSTYNSSNNNNNIWGSLTSSVSSFYQKAKDAVSSLQTNTSAQPTYGAPQPTMGGKRRRKSRRMRGGNFVDNTSRSVPASTAAPISGIRTAQPHNLVGGRSRRRSRKRRHSKSCRSCKR